MLKLSGNIGNAWGKLTPTLNYRPALTASLSVHQPASPPSHQPTLTCPIPTPDKTTWSSEPSSANHSGRQLTFLKAAQCSAWAKHQQIVDCMFQFSLHPILILAAATILNFIFCLFVKGLFRQERNHYLHLTCTPPPPAHDHVSLIFPYINSKNLHCW